MWIQGWKRRRSAARNKRNLTWRPAHFLNGMFPLPLRDIMHRLWITDGKIALRLSLPLVFRPLPLPLHHCSEKRSVNAPDRVILSSAAMPPRCSRADADRYLGQFRFVSYITQSVSQRYPLRGFHVEIPFNRATPSTHALLPSLSLFLSFLSLSLWRVFNSCLPLYPHYPRNLRFIIISEKTCRKDQRWTRPAGTRLVLLAVVGSERKRVWNIADGRARMYGSSNVKAAKNGLRPFASI